MHKRFLAIFAIVATIFAFGVGTALADHYSEDDPHPGCENGNPPGCEDGIPGQGDGHEEEPVTDEPGQPGPQDLCDAVRDLDENLAPVADACDELVGALTGEGGGGSEPQPEPGCESLALDPQLQPVADGCQDLRDALTEAGLPV